METSALPRSQLRVLIVMPVHDDWTSAAELVQRIDKCVPPLEFHIEIILIDDGSALRWERSMFRPSFSVVRKIQILRLHLNVGHQRAIAIGLMHAKQINNCDFHRRDGCRR
jgi:polyisoprenyl-phosphate glycosyltransferase